MTSIADKLPSYDELGADIERLSEEDLEHRIIEFGEQLDKVSDEDGWYFPPTEKLPWEKPKRLRLPRKRDEIYDPKIWARILSKGTFLHPKDFGYGPFPEPVPEWYGEIIPIPPKRPLIFVPGIMATKLGIKPNSPTQPAERIWPPIDFGETTLLSLKRFLEKKKLVPYGGSSGNYHDPDVLVDDTYDGLIHFITNVLGGKKNGYKINQNFFIFGYNWTESNSDSGARLAAFIKIIVDAFYPKNTPEHLKKVDLICHSMGGIVSRAAMNFYGAKCNRVVYIASPHYGAPKAYSFLHPDVDPVTGVKAEIAFFLLERFTALTDGKGEDIEDVLQQATRIMPSVYELLPDYYYFTRKLHTMASRGSVIEKIVNGLKNKKYFYIYDDVCKFPSSMHKNTKRAMLFKRGLGYSLPGDKYLNIPAVSGKTASHAFFPTIGDGYMKSRIHGDGTVVFNSASGPNRNYNSVYTSHVPAPDHAQTHALITLFWTQVD